VFKKTRIAIAFGLSVVASVGLIAQQKPAATARPATASKPDLSGTWTNATITPLERPQGVTDLVLSEEAAARMERAVIARRGKWRAHWLQAYQTIVGGVHAAMAVGSVPSVQFTVRPASSRRARSRGPRGDRARAGAGASA